MLRRGRFSRGDTLIEVLFAVSVFGLVAVGGLTVMNQGSASAQRALEITLVRQQMDAQAETLRFLNNSYVAAYRAGTTIYDPATPAGQWALLAANTKLHPIENVSSLGGSECPITYQGGSFILNAQRAQFVDSSKLTPAKTFSQLIYTVDENDLPVVSSSEGLWIEPVSYDPIKSGDAAQANIGYVDFHIFACWDSPGQAVPVTLGTIVRLYEPR